ncbi:DUF6265 family protein [Roseateles sp. DC23W]|uniref:DUF6265 family protein n=1 Tax=Pelomonas dachongensis TaxID=3299029 RepID=A0ABW7EHB8_9BURK
MKLLPTLVLAASAPFAQAQPDPLTPVAWMAGCWTQTGREPGSVEQWMAPAAGVMLGMARIVKGGRVTEFEFMQLRADADGRLSFIAQPQGRAPTAFPLRSQGEAEAVFENRDHDFPQRVMYRRDGSAGMLARIEGEINGKVRGIDFAMQRTPCP